MVVPDGGTAGDPVEQAVLSPRDVPALAPNWRTVLIVDVLMGVLMIAAGVVASLVWSVVLGAFLAAVGMVYVLLVARRWRRWAGIRRIMLPDGDG